MDKQGGSSQTKKVKRSRRSSDPLDIYKVGTKLLRPRISDNMFIAINPNPRKLLSFNVTF